MSKTKVILTGAVFALIALALVLSPTSASLAKKAKTKAKAKGYITAIDAAAGTVTIADSKSGQAVTVTVTESTKLRKNKTKGASLADLVVGDKAKTKYNADTLDAKRIRAKSPKAHGELSAIDLDAKTVTIQPAVGEPIVLQVTDDTRIKRDHEKATLDELQVGDRVKAKQDPTTMSVLRIRATSE
jgi:hypothetical protein